MSFITGLMNLGRKANIAKGSVVAAKDIMKGKLNITDVTEMASVSKLLRSPEADKFVLSAKKQNAEILSDVIVKPYYNATLRVITKKLPSGTTIKNVYDDIEGFYGKQIINKKGSVIARSKREFDGSKINHVFMENYQTGQNFVGEFGEKLEYTSSTWPAVISTTLRDVLKMVNV